MLTLVPVVALLVSLVSPRPALPPVSASVTVAGDSVVLVVAVADVPQTVSVDSVEFFADLNAANGSGKMVRVAHTAGSTTGRLAWGLSQWGPNQTKGSKIKVRFGRAAACAGGFCWSPQVASVATWSYTLDAVAPNPPDSATITVQSVGLN